MQDKDLIRKTRESLEKFRKLPAKKRLEHLIKRGVVDKDGRVLMNGEKPTK